MLSNVFIAGYTDFVTSEFLTAAFPGCRIVVSGGCSVKESTLGKISRFQGELSASACRSLFHTYDFGMVVYFSQGLIPFGHAPGQELDILSNLISAGYPETKIIYLSGPGHLPPSPWNLQETTFREICRRLAQKTGGIQFLVCPWTYHFRQPHSVLSELFRPGLHKLDYPADQQVFFLAAEDLAVLLYRIFEDWDPQKEPFYLPAGSGYSLKALTEQIRKLAVGRRPEFEFSNSPAEVIHPADGVRLRARYLWSPIYSLEEDLRNIAKLSQAEQSQKHVSFPSLAGLPLRILELLTAGAICELMLKMTNTLFQFRMIDFRLLTIVILGSIYNIPMGISAAFMESISLVWAYNRSGIGWLTLFHEPTNWLPFISFFTVGAVCGYLRSRDQSELKYVQEENQSLKQRYVYLRKINDDVLREKQEYKQQIIGSRDSFGKLFSISQQLNQRHPKHLLSKSVDVLETTMGRAKVAIYSCGFQQAYGRLSVSSRDCDLPHSMPMCKYYECLLPLNDGEAWVNRSLEPGMPQYLYAIRKDGKISLVLMILKTDYNQMSLYHENIFRIVCGLISNSLVSAMEYQDAVYLTHCVAGSERILVQDYFQEELDFAISSAEQNQATHLLLQLNVFYPLSEIEARLDTCIRTTDIVGYIGSSIYVLLLQAKQEDLTVIGNRFAAAGLSYSVISRERQSELLKKEEMDACSIS